MARSKEKGSGTASEGETPQTAAQPGQPDETPTTDPDTTDPAATPEQPARKRGKKAGATSETEPGKDEEPVPEEFPAPDEPAGEDAQPAGEEAGAPEAAEAPGEDAAEAAPQEERAPVEPPFPPAPAQGSGGGFAAGLLGGALAVAAGIGVLWISNPDLLRGDYMTDLTPLIERVETAEAETAAMAEEVASLRQSLADLQGAPSEAEGLTERIGELESGIAERIDAVSGEIEALSAALDVLEGRVAQVEVRPPVMEGDAGEATAQVVAEMRAALDAQRAEIDQLVEEARGRIEEAEAEAAEIQAQADAAARAAVARAALSRLTAALEAGGPYAGALADLTGATDVAVPEPLLAAADTGVPTLGDLQRAFPEAAREALSASIRAGVEDDASPMERLGAFLRAQTGARSITPRDGDDPDAVLSRAEAALAEGNVAEAVTLTGALPEPGQEALAGWRALAETRLAALDAAETLSAALPAN